MIWYVFMGLVLDINPGLCTYRLCHYNNRSVRKIKYRLKQHDHVVKHWWCHSLKYDVRL